MATFIYTKLVFSLHVVYYDIICIEDLLEQMCLSSLSSLLSITKIIIYRRWKP